MIAFPEMLVGPANAAGMRVPPDLDDYNPEDFPHFNVYSKLQLGAAMPYPDSHWTNALIVASITEDKIRAVTFDDLRVLGFEEGFVAP